MEELLRARAGGDPNFRLSDYFDLIGGTSTGSIIAAGLSLGMTAEEVRDHYFTLGERDVQAEPAPDRRRPAEIRCRERGERAQGALQGSHAREQRLQDRAHGDEQAPGHRKPMAAQQQSRGAVISSLREGSTTIPNGEYPLWKVVRASTAAPYYFAPERIVIKTGDTKRDLKGVVGEFVDGGVSPANNPSLALVLMATIKGYAFNWEMGPRSVARRFARYRPQEHERRCVRGPGSDLARARDARPCVGHG